MKRLRWIVIAIVAAVVIVWLLALTVITDEDTRNRSQTYWNTPTPGTGL